MASKTTAFATLLLQHFFQNAALTNVGDAGGLLPSAAAGSFYISLHTADPGLGGDQTTNEATYTGHNRPAVARSGAAWDVTGNVASNLAAITFAQCTGGSNVITHVGIGSAAAGAGNLHLRKQLTAPVTVSNLITPSFDIAALTITET